MDDFSSELFSSFFEDHLLERPLLADRPSPLHMDVEDSSPGQLCFHYEKSFAQYTYRFPFLTNKRNRTKSPIQQLPGLDHCGLFSPKFPVISNVTIKISQQVNVGWLNPLRAQTAAPEFPSL